MFAPTSLRLAAAIAAICYFHLFFYSTEGPVLTLTSAAVLFLPVYARKLEVPARHPIKTILYYLFWTQNSYLWTAYVEVLVVIGIFLYTHRALKGLSATTLRSGLDVASADHEAQACSTLNKASETQDSAEDNPGQNGHTDSISSTTVDITSSDPITSPVPEFPIKAWPFQIVAVFICYVGLLALVEGYFDSIRFSALVKPRPRRVGPYIRGIGNQIHYALVLIGIQGYVSLPLGSYKRALYSLLATVHWPFAVLYLIPANIGFYLLVESHTHQPVYPYLLLLSNILFSTGPHYGLALAFVWHLYHVCLEPPSVVTTQKESNPQGNQEPQQQEFPMGTVRSSQIEIHDSAHSDASPQYAVKSDIPEENPGIDIADLSSYIYSTGMIYGDDDQSPLHTGDSGMTCHTPGKGRFEEDIANGDGPVYENGNRV